MEIQIILGILITLIVGLVSIGVTLYLSRRTTVNQRQLQQLISRITGLFSVSQRVGIDTAYEDRKVALATRADQPTEYTSFVSRFETEKKLVVIGSSL